MKTYKGAEYEAELRAMQHELVAMARWARHCGQRIAIVMEGRDTAGKGGAIRAITEHLDTRQFRVVALPKPGPREQGEWYFQRYVQHLPAAGEIVLFDRSWYNRAGVEKVMGFATQAEVDAFLAQAPLFEQLLVDDGIRLFKYWLCCDQAQQEERFAERLEDPLKAWKLSPIDVEARLRYDDYTQAREEMLAATHTAHAPWTLVDFNHQKSGRLALIRNLLDRLPDVGVPQQRPVFAPLPGPPSKERFGVLQPIRPYGDRDRSD
ncbi:MAG TPA: polyphosphate kinase 2 [Luteimonas sp.]